MAPIPLTPDQRRRFATNVRTAIEETGLSLVEFARINHFGYPTVRSWAEGTRVARGEKLRDLAKALRCSQARLIAGVF